MNRRLFVASLFAALLGGCQLDEQTEGPVAACMTAGSACNENRQCCSYGCVDNVCVRNPEDGGLCRTSDDCAGGACRDGRCDQDAVCRDESDVCAWDGQCCTETCNGGRCVPNQAPVVVVTSNANAEGLIPTGTPIVFDARGSSDPDGDALSYGWQVVRIPSLAAVPCAGSSAGGTCTIVAPPTGTYRAMVTVSDGKVGTAPQGTVEVEVVNLPPEVTAMAASDETPSRNVAFTVTASVLDPDGDPLACAWTATAPGGTPQTIAGATDCAALPYTAAAEGTWTFTILPDDGVENAITTRSVSVTVVNDAPVASAAADVYGNMGETEATTDPIALAATASDANGDAPLAFAWTQTAGAAVVLSDATSPAPTFVPPGEGLYAFTVTATDPAQFDRPGATSAPVTVTVHVGRRVIALPGVVRDAERARSSGGADLIVAVGADPADATKGKLWVIAAADGSIVREASLPTVANSVSTNADASLVAVGANAAFYWVAFGTATAVNQGAEPFAVGDVVLAGSKRIFLFPSAATSGSYIYAFDVTSSTTSPVTTGRYGQTGRLSPDGASLYAVDGYWDEILRYSAVTSGQPGSALGYGAYVSYSPYGCTPAGVWTTSTGSEFFTNCGDVYTASTMAKRADLTTYLGGSFVHADANGGIVVSRGGRLDRLDANFQPAGSDVVPVWGWDGKYHSPSADFAFLGSDGTRYAVVSAGAGRSGLVSFAP